MWRNHSRKKKWWNNVIFKQMFIHEAPIFLLALPGLSAGCGTHTPGWSSGAEASATQAHKKMKTQLSWRGKKKRLNDSFTSFNMAGNKLADWWQYVTSDWCSRRFSCLWRDLGKMFSRKEVGWFRVLSWRNSLGWKKFSSTALHVSSNASALWKYSVFVSLSLLTCCLHNCF